MKRISLFAASVFSLLVELFYATERVSAAGDTVDVSRLNGFSSWLFMLYNEHRIIYALTSVIVMVAIGAILGLTMEFILARMGHETERMEREKS